MPNEERTEDLHRRQIEFILHQLRPRYAFTTEDVIRTQRLLGGDAHAAVNALIQHRSRVMFPTQYYPQSYYRATVGLH